MGLRINTNVASLTSQRSLGNTTQSLNKSLEQLASGSRINRSGDDAAGLAISESLKAKIKGGQQAERNALDGVSMIQVAEGGLNEMTNILIRLRELAVQAASDTIGDRERVFTNMEFTSLIDEVDRIANSTEFNNVKLLKGEGDELEFQVGINNDETLDRLVYSPEDANATADNLDLSGKVVETKEDAQEVLEVIDVAINDVSGNRAGLGALQNRLLSTITNLQIANENMSAANSRIRDTDVAQASSDLARNNILMASGTSVLAQANQLSNVAMKLIG